MRNGENFTSLSHFRPIGAPPHVLETAHLQTISHIVNRLRQLVGRRKISQNCHYEEENASITLNIWVEVHFVIPIKMKFSKNRYFVHAAVVRCSHLRIEWAELTLICSFLSMNDFFHRYFDVLNSRDFFTKLLPHDAYTTEPRGRDACKISFFRECYFNGDHEMYFHPKF